MACNKKCVCALVTAVLAVVITGRGTEAQAPAGRSFSFLAPGFTQQLFGSTGSFLVPNTGYLGGVAVLPDSAVIVAECVFNGTRLHRFDAVATTVTHGTTLHAETLLPSDGGCGVAYHPDGTLYLNTDPASATGPGITNVDPATGTVIRRFGQRGNGAGIAVDPITNHIVYTGNTCAPDTACTIFDLDPVTGVTTTFAAFTAAQVGYANGIAFDPTGAYLFVDNRTPVNRLTVVTRAGVIVQDIAMPSVNSQPVGIGFSATAPKFVVTNNTDGTMQRFDFPNDDFTQVPTRSVFASGGYRGDLMQAGPDGCLYVTQGGTRFDDGTNEDGITSNSIVRICGAVPFAPPAGVPLTPRPTTGTVQGVVTNVGGSPIDFATVLLSAGSAATTNASGAYSITVAGGTYSATVTAAGYQPASRTGIVVTNGASTTENFTLVALPPPVIPGTLTGLVTNASNGSVIVSATVAMSNGASITTDANGRYTFTLQPATYSATVTASNYATVTAAGLVVPNGGTLTKNFALTPMPPLNPCKTANDYFALGAASTYTLLGIDIAGCGYTTLDIEYKTTAIGGDLGIGASVDAYLESATVQGNLVTDPGSWVTRQKSFIVQGSTRRASLAAAASAMKAAAARMAKLTPTQKLAAVSTSVTITGKGGVNVVSIPTLKIVGGAVTIQGGASDIFVFNVAGKFELDASKVVLTGGVRACNILWNFTGTNISEPNEVELENGSVGAGIFLSPSRLVEVLDSTHTGRVLAGGDITVYSSTIKPQ